VSDTKHPEAPPYLGDILDLLAGNVTPGGVLHIEVRHERNCDLLNRRGQCNCACEAKLVKPQ
jgi:hypothetical protein